MPLRKSRWDPWASSHATVNSEERSISKVMIVLLAFELFFEFVSICCFASLAGFQHKWGIGVSGLTAFLLLLLPPLFLLSLLLLIPPLIFDKYDKLITLNTFIGVRRNRWILLALGLGIGGLGAVIVTGSAFTEPGCKNPSNDPHAKLGDDFKHGLKSWCTTKKASAVFLWLNVGCWLASLIYFFVITRRAAQSTPLSSYRATKRASTILPESNLPTSYDADESGRNFAERMKEAYASTNFSGWAGRAVSKKWNVPVDASDERELDEKEMDEEEEEEVPVSRAARARTRFARLTNSRSGSRNEEVDLGTRGMKDADDEIYAGIPRYSVDEGVYLGSRGTSRQVSEDRYAYPDMYAGGRAKTPAVGQGLVGGQLRGVTPQPGPLSRTMLLASGSVYDDPFAKAHAVLHNQSTSALAAPPASYRYNSEHYSNQG